jgi:hypothetical protein
MFNSTDLMKYSESQMNKYVCKLMNVVYTRDELKEGLIIEGEATTSTRKRLELAKFNLIKSNHQRLKFIYIIKLY